MATAFLTLSLLANSLDPTTRNLDLAILVVGDVATLVVSAIALYVYDQNAIVIRPDRLEFHNQYSLLGSRSSECAIWEVQDVSYSQVGLFPALIGYATLIVQTAGTQEKFTFSYTPKPEWIKDYIENLEKAPSQYYSTTF